VLWNNPNFNGGHVVLTTGIEYDADGNPKNVIINDTGTGECGAKIPADQYEASLRNDQSDQMSIVTDSPIW
jgi:hypothetical protein